MQSNNNNDAGSSQLLCTNLSKAKGPCTASAYPAVGSAVAYLRARISDAARGFCSSSVRPNLEYH